MKNDGILSLRGLREGIETKGLHLRALQTEAPIPGTPTMPEGITLIPAYSPETRGRSERAFRTLQDRLPNELTLAGITEMAAANRYLAEQFLLIYNRRFAVPAPEAGTAFRPVDRHAPRRDPVCARKASRGQGYHRTGSPPAPTDSAGPPSVP